MDDLQISETLLSWLEEAHPGSIEAAVQDWPEATWAAAQRVAFIQGIAPLLHARLGKSGAAECLDPQFRAYLEEQYRLNGLRNAKLAAEYRDIAKRVAEAGIPAIPLKGIVLAERHYSDPALRPMADLDFLIRYADESQFARVLFDMEYYRLLSTSRHRSFRSGRYNDAIASYEGEHPDNPVNLELHTSIWLQLANAVRFDITPLFRDGLEAHANGADGLEALSLPALYLHLLFHAGGHMFAGNCRAIHVHDIALLAPRLSQADWEHVLEQAEQFEIARILYPPLALAKRYFQADIPATCSETLRSWCPPALPGLVEGATLSDFSMLRHDFAPHCELEWLFPGRERTSALITDLIPIRRMALQPEAVIQRYPRACAVGLWAGYLAHAGRLAFWPLIMAARLFRPERFRRMWALAKPR